MSNENPNPLLEPKPEEPRPVPNPIEPIDQAEYDARQRYAVVDAIIEWSDEEDKDDDPIDRLNQLVRRINLAVTFSPAPALKTPEELWEKKIYIEPAHGQAIGWFVVNEYASNNYRQWDGKDFKKFCSPFSTYQLALEAATKAWEEVK